MVGQLKTEMQTVDPQTLAQAIQKAAALIRAGNVVAVPTETVYGLAADATSSEAVEKIYAAKGRPSFNPLIVHVSRSMKSLSALEKARIVDASKWTPVARSAAQRLMDYFWPGPLTIVMPRGERIADNAAGGLDTVAVRMPDHGIFLALIEETGVPLAAPSANLSKRISPTTAEHVLSELGGRIPLILDGGAAKVGLESTIVAITPSGRLRLLRPGGLPSEGITAKTGLGFDQTKDSTVKGIQAPGMMLEHYAPSKPMFLVGEGDTEALSKWYRAWRTQANVPKDHAVGILLFGEGSGIPEGWRQAIGEVSCQSIRLSDREDGSEAARDLFSALRQLDESDVSCIVAASPEATHGLWPAIMDRLTRAAARWA